MPALPKAIADPQVGRPLVSAVQMALRNQARPTCCLSRRFRSWQPRGPALRRVAVNAGVCGSRDHVIGRFSLVRAGLYFLSVMRPEAARRETEARHNRAEQAAKAAPRRAGNRSAGRAALHRRFWRCAAPVGQGAAEFPGRLSLTGTGLDAASIQHKVMVFAKVVEQECLIEHIEIDDQEVFSTISNKANR